MYSSLSGGFITYWILFSYDCSCLFDMVGLRGWVVVLCLIVLLLFALSVCSTWLYLVDYLFCFVDWCLNYLIYDVLVFLGLIVIYLGVGWLDDSCDVWTLGLMDWVYEWCLLIICWLGWLPCWLLIVFLCVCFGLILFIMLFACLEFVVITIWYLFVYWFADTLAVGVDCLFVCVLVLVGCCSEVVCLLWICLLCLVLRLLVACYYLIVWFGVWFC